MVELPLTPPILRNGKNFSGCVRDGSYLTLWDNTVIAVPSRSPTDCFDESVVNNQSVATSTISSATSVNYSRAPAHPELSSLMSQYGIHQYDSFLPSLCPSPLESKPVEGDGKLFRPAFSLPPTPSSQQADEGIIFSSSFENLVRSYDIQEYASMLPLNAYLADEEPYSPEGEGMETDDDEDCEIDVEAFSDEFDEFMSEVSGEDDDDFSDDQDSVTFFSSSPIEGSNICSNAPVQAAY